MKRITIATTLTFALLFCAYAQKPAKVVDPQRAESAPSISSVAWDEYTKIVRSKQGEAAIKAWARKHKLEIVSLKGYDIVVAAPDRQEITDDLQRLGCSVSTCPTASGYVVVMDKFNPKKEVGTQRLTCKATTCKFEYNKDLKRYIRRCGGYKCTTTGSVIPW